MKKLTSIIVIFLSFSVYNVQAVPITQKGEVARIYLSGNGNVFIKLKSYSVCTPAHSNHYYTLLRKHASFNETYALLLAAAHSGGDVKIRADNATCSSTTVFSTQITYVLQEF